MKKIGVLVLLAMMSVFTACKQEHISESEEYSTQENVRMVESTDEEEEFTNWQEMSQEIAGNEENTWLESTEAEANETITIDAQAEARAAEMKAMFGDHCIAEQTFEVEMSEFDGKVYVVPYIPSWENSEFHMEIIQNGEVLANLWEYLPEELEGKKFTSLDAVSFFDANFDDCTDVVVILTYGEETFTTVYYGFPKDADEYDRRFYGQLALSEQITRQLSELTIPEIRRLLTDGKKNGEFMTYQEAYRMRSHLCELEAGGKMTYDLIYFDDDDIPELAAGVTGYYVSLYTYSDGRLYTLMNEWAYGAMGNHGYDYSPRKNSLRNYNTDYAGLIMHETYMGISDQHTLDIIASIKFFNFDDANGNGRPDEEEEDSVGEKSAIYLNGVESTDEECAVYDMGEYESIHGAQSYEELLLDL